MPKKQNIRNKGKNYRIIDWANYGKFRYGKKVSGRLPKKNVGQMAIFRPYWALRINFFRSIVPLLKDKNCCGKKKVEIQI